MQLFSEWLTFSLEQQQRDLELYLAGLPDRREVVLENWVKLAPYRNLIPSPVRGVERRLYIADLTTLLDVLKNAPGAAAPDSDTSPPR